MNYIEQKVLILGLGLSGEAAAEELLKKGAEVAVWDEKDEKELKSSARLKTKGVEIFTGKNFPDLNRFSLVVTSPGIDSRHPLLEKAQKIGLPVLSELELGFRQLKGKLIAITGTNGKTTTTFLTAAILKQAGFSAFVAGNIGVPLIKVASFATAKDIVVAEVSSFQLEHVCQFHPHLAVFLNLTPDHLNRHQTMENYLKTKAKIFERQNQDDYAILNGDDPYVFSLAPSLRAKKIIFSRNRSFPGGVWLENETIVADLKGKAETICSIREINLFGPHNIENVLAATAAALVFDVKKEDIASALRNFQGVEHRLEKVLEKEGVLYVNDSKGTNVDSTLKALDSFERPLILIAGGKDKGSSFTELARKIKEKVKYLILLGETKGKIRKAVEEEGFEALEEVDTIEEAVKKAFFKAERGDVVLLSPACASWDMFNNYEERGKVFKEEVLKLNEEQNNKREDNE